MRDILFFIIAFVGLLSGLVFFKRSNLPLSVFQTTLGCFLTELCIGTIVAKIYSFLSITIDLKSMGMAYFVLGAMLWGYSLKTKQFQKLKINLWDMYSCLVITVGFMLLFFAIFTVDIVNKYINSDAASHFTLALNVMDSGKIFKMHFGELFNGLILSAASHFWGKLSLYKVYILSDAFANLINIFMFYMLADTICRHKVIKILLPFLCFGYFLGWPLYSFVLGGFGYLAWGVSLFAYIVYLLVNFYSCNEKEKQIQILFVIGINCIGLTFCYMLFVPLAGMVILITLIWKAKKNKNLFSKKSVSVCVGVLAVGCVIAWICFRGYFGGNMQYFLSVLQMDGWTHKDLYRDFVFLMPAVLYMGWYYIKNHELNLIFASTAVIFAFICITFVLCIYNKMSPYYFYKSYYLFWLFSWLLLVNAMDYFMNKDKGVVMAYGIAFSVPVFMTLSGIDNMLEEKGIVVNEKHSSYYPSFYPILDGYAYYLGEENNWLEDKEALLDMSSYILNNFSEEKEIPLIVCDGRWGYWYYSFTRQDSIFVANGNELLDALSDYIQAGYEYVVIHQNSDTYRKVKEKISKYEKKYDNGYYGLYHVLY